MGNGKHVRFWTDRWTLSMEPFYDIVSTELSPFEMDIKVCDYVLNGNWDFRIFQGIILEDIIICIRVAKTPLASYGTILFCGRILKQVFLC